MPLRQSGGLLDLRTILPVTPTGGIFFRRYKHSGWAPVLFRKQALAWTIISYWYFLKLYCSASFAFCSGFNPVKYFFHPGQKLMWNRQNRPARDFGLLSYFARKAQLSQVWLAIDELHFEAIVETKVATDCTDYFLNEIKKHGLARMRKNPFYQILSIGVIRG